MSNEVECCKIKRKLLFEIIFYIIIILFYLGINIAKNNHKTSIIDGKGKLLTESILFSNP